MYNKINSLADKYTSPFALAPAVILFVLTLCFSQTGAQEWFHPELGRYQHDEQRDERNRRGWDDRYAPYDHDVHDTAVSSRRLSREERREERDRERRFEREQRERQRERDQRSWRVRSVDFTGNATYSDKDLISLMELKPRWPSYKVRFTNFLMNSDLGVLRSFYYNRGFQQAEVKLDSVVRDTANRRVHIYIAIEEGLRTHVSEVTVASDRYQIRPSEMRRLLTKPGVPLIHQDVRLDSRRVRNILGNRGFLAASVAPEIEYDTANHLAHVVFNVTEGPKAVVGEIEVVGNEGISNSVVRRELTFRRGDTLNLRTVQQSERRLYGTGLYNFVQIRPEFDSTRAPEELPDSAYNVQVRVSPTEFFSMQGGVGYSTDERGRVSASAAYRNMFRLGHALTVSGKLSQISQGAEAAYIMPWFLYMPLQFNTKVYYTRYDNAELYEGVFNGIRLSAGRQSDYNLLYQFWTQWEQVQWVRAPGIEEDGPVGVPDFPTQSIGGDISYDMRNDLFNPTKGGVAHLGVEIAGVFGGKSNQFIKITSDNRVYFSRRSRYFLSHALRAGWVMPYGESEVVPVQSQFYGGGSNTVRGFPVNRLAVLPNNDPLKGNFYVFANVADFRFPLFWWVNGALFLDAGNVWPGLSDITSARDFFDDLRWSAGPGIRVDTPIRLVARLDLGFKIDRRPGESLMELHFDLGQPF
jgi:outer membrane protein assembly complex protein YaeT